MMNDATRAQVDAARPDLSTWLAANAGSGKTRVLTDRVARLLLEGVEPQHILCLTYTKAAASEMQNRLFKRLGEWAMLADGPLRKTLAELGLHEEPDVERLRQARTLFALAIETPGGLKIQTIHSFCASLLRRFPLEAGVNPQFTEIEERAADLLREEIVDEMADGEERPLVEAVAAFHTAEDFGPLTRTIVSLSTDLAVPLSRDDALLLLGQPAGLTEAEVTAKVLLGHEQALVQSLLPALRAGKDSDRKAAQRLGGINQFDLSALPTLESLLLTGSSAKAPFSAKIGAFPTKDVRTALDPNLLERLNDLMERVEAGREARLALLAVERTLALQAFARSFLGRYEAAKEARGWLDFDDLINRARQLLSQSDMADWVLYRIDGGIDHILVDEAQDTSPRQWDVIEKLTEEAFAGRGVRPETERTLFVVGDKKQSIYSFQGADPEEFDRKANLFRSRIEGAGKPFQRRSLDYSFRSAGAILRLVDRTFDPQRRPAFGKESEHVAFKTALPGRVDLWPVVPKTETQEEDQHWTDPLDRISNRHHFVLLAEKVADRVKTLCTEPHFIPDQDDAGTLFKRRITPGDFLILVQSRSALFSHIIRACKARDLPIAGADRLKVGAELAVRDLAALLSFLATPDDDLSLATALKSPLLGWDEQDLFSLANPRQGKLWEALRQRGEEDETVAMLRDLRNQTDFLRPYDLIERILTRHRGRARLLNRLGAEAEEGINALLSQALAYERSDIPSLTGFIEWMQTDSLEIKRQVDSASDQIRVMTVHGAKGLEAPIVILPDTGKKSVQFREDIVPVGAHTLWKGRSDEAPAAISKAVEEAKLAEEKERLRLLYVAMTRAEKWLIVAAAGELSKDGTAWYDIVQEAMTHENAVAIDDVGTLRLSEGDWEGLEERAKPQVRADTPLLDPVFEVKEETGGREQVLHSPSDLGGAKALPGDEGEEEDRAKAYGTLVHQYLERLPTLPETAWEDWANLMPADLPPEVIETAFSEAKALLQDRALAPVFTSDALTEVPITAEISGQAFFGVVDRLILEEDRLLAVDFKTNRIVPEAPKDCPEGLLRQMGAYARMLEAIYPGKRVEVAILWTGTRQLMILPHNLVTAALDRAPLLDGAKGST